MNRIKNPEIFAPTEARQLARQLIEAGLEAIDTGTAVRRAVRLKPAALQVADRAYPLDSAGRLIVVGIGKCAMDAAIALEEILGERLEGGVVVDIRPTNTCPLLKIKCFQGDHPFPSERNVDATREIITALGGLTERDLVLVIVSGGGSTLLCQPENATCHDEELVVQTLFRAGAPIGEINLVRKHLSRARGGFLASYAYPAQVVGLIFSDVPGDDLGSIASGPTVFDPSTRQEAWAVAERYSLPATAGLRPEFLLETPKDEKFFAAVSNELIVSNQLALEAMKRQAETVGWAARVVTTELTGEVGAVAARLAADLATQLSRSISLYGGETTVLVRGDGVGGRNQELALAALADWPEDALLVTLASDGRDNGDAAGALCDTIISEQARVKNLAPDEYRRRNDSANFFQQVDGQILTGPTGANVSDLIISIKE